MNRSLLVSMLVAGCAGIASAQIQFQTASPLPSGVVGQFYSAAAVTNSQVAVHCTLSGALPAGLALSDSGNACVIQGVPSQSSPAPFGFALIATAPGQGTATAQYQITISPSAQGFVITTTTLPDATLNTSYNAAIQTAGSAGGLAACLIPGGSLPPGLSMAASQTSCLISGTPTQAGSFPFQVAARDVQNNTTPIVTLNINVNNTTGGTLQITTTFVQSGAVNTSYQFQFQATGGTGSYVWQVVSGSLPPGLTLAQSGFLSGFPTQNGNYFFTVQVTSGLQSATASYTQSIGTTSGLQITTTFVPSGTQGVNYLPNGTTFFFQATGGNGTYSWQLLSGSLPPGLFLNSSGNGSLTGTPQQAGNYSFTIQVSSGSDQSVSQFYTMSISSSGSGLQITTTFVPSGTQGVNYLPNGTTFFFQATGGSGSYNWQVISGSLPSGLFLNSSGNGSLTGTPQQAGNFSFTVQVTSGSQQSVSQFYTMSISSSGSGLQITTTFVPSGTQGVNYLPNGTTFFFQATGGNGTYTWQVVSGSLPPGLFLNSSGSGSLTGTPQQSGNFSFTVQVTSGSQQSVSQFYTMSISTSGGSLQITTTSPLPSGVLGVNYLPNGTTFFFQATGGNGTYTWQVVSGFLPPGLFLNSSGSGSLTGTPQQVGTYSFGVQVTSAGFQSTVQNFQMTISNTGSFQITTTSVPSAVFGTQYLPNGTVFQFQATGGSGSYTWQVVSGFLPPGLALGFTDGTLTGTPTQIGTYTFGIQATSGSFFDTGNQTTNKTFTMTVSTGRLRIIENTLPFAITGQAYSITIHADGGAPPYQWSLGSTTLAGLSIDQFSGVLSGTPLTSGNYSIPVTVRDTSGSASTQVFSLFVAAPLGILNDSLPDGLPNTNYLTASGTTVFLQAGGGQGPYSWSIASGSLPPGITLNSSTGSLTGVATAQGRFSFTVRVTDSGGRIATKDLSILVGTPVSVSTSSLPDGAVGVQYSQTLVASGGQGPYTWTVSGTLPDGLTLSSAGVIAGSPTAAGTFSFTVTAKDSQGSTAQKSLSINIVNPIVITTGSIQDGTRNVAYNQAFGANGGTPPYSWSIVSGALPNGLTLIQSTGLLTGTPLNSGSFGFTVQVKDALGQTVNKNYLLNIIEPLSITTDTISVPFGSAVSVSLVAAGGFTPYTWDIINGALPIGLNLSAGGVISGTPTVPGTVTLTVRVSDSRSSPPAQKQISITVTLPALPAVTVRVANPNGSQPGPNQQPTVNLSLASTFPSDITGTLTLTFTPLSGTDPQEAKFANNSLRTLNFTVRQGTTTATFPSAPSGAAVMVGTVAGTIAVSATSLSAAGVPLDVTLVPVQRITIDPAPPVITGVQLVQTSGGVNVIVSGFATTREVTSGTFRFAAATGSTLQTTDFTVALTSAFAAWYSSTQSNATGSQFTLTVPFSVSGSAPSIVSVSVTLTNSRGNSNTATP